MVGLVCHGIAKLPQLLLQGSCYFPTVNPGLYQETRSTSDNGEMIFFS